MAVDTSQRARRRSLKKLLHIPLFPRTTGLAGKPIPTMGPAPTGPQASLPEDVLRSVVEDMSSGDILSLSLTSKHIRELLVPALYRTVHLRSSAACNSGLRMLALRPELCAHVRKLAVRPNYYLAWPVRDASADEEWVARTIMQLAPALRGLRTFDWDGTEMPPEGLWRTLRSMCPDLKEVLANVGHRPILPDSELFNFRALTTFSLSVRHGLGEHDLFPPHEQLPVRLWTMLEGCPTLAELTLASFSPAARLFDLTPLSSARWPQLASLTLGAFGYDHNFGLAGPPAGFDAFLAVHPALTHLRLAWSFQRWMSPADLPPLALPAGLIDFSGVAQQLGLGGGGALTTLDLMCEPLYEARAPALCTALRGLPALTALELWVHVPDPLASHAELWAALWGAAPGLEDLHFMCTTAFGRKPLAELARALRCLPRLRSFALTKGHRYADESMRASAVRVFKALARRNPSSTTCMGTDCGRGSLVRADTEDADEDVDEEKSDSEPGEMGWEGGREREREVELTQVSVRWARAACRNHLKQQGTYERVAPRSAAAVSGDGTDSPTSPTSRGGVLGGGTRRRSMDDGKGGTEVGDGRGWKGREKDVVEAWERGLRAVGGAFERRYRFALALPSSAPSSSPSSSPSWTS